MNGVSFEDLRAVYLPSRYFGGVESLMLQGRLPAFRLLTADDVEADVHNSYLCTCFSVVIKSILEERLITAPVYICFMDNLDKVSAFAMTVGDEEYCIFISTGMMAQMAVSASVATSYEPVRDYFGLPPSERMIPERGIGLTYEKVREVVTQKPNAAAFMPFSWLNVVAIILHELGHIIDGHLDFLSMYKVDIDQLSDNDKSTLMKTLEFDANCFAASEMRRHLHATKEVPQFAAPLMQSSDHRTTATLISMTSIFQFEDLTTTLAPDADLAFQSHPPLRWRMLGAKDTIHAVLAKEQGGDSQKASELLDRGLRLSVGLLMDTSSSYRLSPDYMSEFYGELDRRMHRLGEHLRVWAAVRPLLAPLKKGCGALAPAQAEPDGRFAFGVRQQGTGG